MRTVAVALRVTVLVAGFAVLGAAAVSSIRARLSGAGFGTVLDQLERRWFGAGSVLLALLVGAAAMVGTGHLTGEGVRIDEAALAVFPLALAASFAVRRLTAKNARGTTVRLAGLVVAPGLLGAMMSAAG
ncbi:hypothetical protein [Streptomyces sp. enrichment culture]|uniref:hypothetical protein n=1 Tax=Streptomyces sp. enrichment culture TaxID=1795815 RepID=UPI003F560625